MGCKTIVTSLLCGLLLRGYGYGQASLTEDAFITQALAQNPAAKAGALSVEQSLARQGTAYAIPNLLVQTESPTGNFYALGASQTVRLPGYYQKQSRLLKAETGAVQAEATLTRVQVLARARQLYLQAQYFQSLDSLLAFQDSLYGTVANAALRLYRAGQTDALQSAFAATQAGEIAVARQANIAMLAMCYEQLREFGGLQSALRVTSLFRAGIRTLVPIVVNRQAATVLLAEQNTLVARAATRVEQARFKPSFTMGYLNQGPRETLQELRLRGGIDIPIWTKQYTSSIRAAQIGERIAERNLDAQRQAFRLDSIQLTGQRTRLAQSLERYERELNPQSDQIISASTRLRQVGNLDVISHLRTVNDAFGIKLRYLELMRQWRETQISTAALSGGTAP